nr:pentatricopeptide repeat protein AaPPR210 [Agave angustifolia]
MNPTTVMFNLVLNSCLQFRSLLKAQQIIELMPLAGVVADVNTVVIIARIYEMVGQRDELKKLQGNIDAVSNAMLNRHYQQFYDSLLSLHFKFNDLDSAAELVLNLYRRQKSLQPHGASFMRGNGLQTQCLFQIGSSNLKMGSKIVVDPVKLQKDLVVDTHIQSGFVLFMDGKLVPSNKVFAKFINGYVKENKVNKLSSLLINIQKEVDSREAILCSDVVDACIQTGWLETAHDILDDLESASIPVRASTYVSLLRAYGKENMLDESKLLLKQMRKAGHFVTSSDENFVLLEDGRVDPLDKRNAGSDWNSDLVLLLDREIRGESTTSSLVFEFNISILFFCKAKMMDDALKTFKRMQERDIQPTVQTFSHLINAYSSLNMYRQITILWGEIRRRLENRVLTADRDMLDCLLCNFLRGGYFERVMEIVNYMLMNNMYTDKWKYKKEFLKLHKDLYRSLKASDARTDAQSKRLEHVRAFRRWLGIDQKLQKK